VALSRCFKHTFLWALAVQAVVWFAVIVFVCADLSTGKPQSSDIRQLGEGMMQLYGGWLVNWYCDHYVPNVETNIGTGLFLFLFVAPCFLALYAVIAAFLMAQLRKT
jgi:hypothetical protein